MDRETEITQRIELLKKKNELLMQRHKEIEEDRKNAEKTRSSVHMKPSKAYSSMRKGDPAGKHSHAHMDHMETTPHLPQKHQPAQHSRGRGAIPHRRPGRGRGRGGRGTYEEKRIENFRLMEEEMSNLETTDRSQSADVGGSCFLDDPRRRGDLQPEERWKTTRHKGSYGGLQFDNVKQGIRQQTRDGNYRGQGQGRGHSKLQMSAEWTGRQRQDHERWMEMREAADKEIMARSKNTQGKWRREWDSAKLDNDDHGFGRDDRQRRTNFGGRGKHWSRGGRGSGRRGSHSSRDGENGRNESIQPDATAPEEDKKNAEIDQPSEPVKEPDPPESPGVPQKPQSQRQNVPRKERKKMSPRHLKQQRAQTPSSKDGTEVWAQNSHHSDEAGAEWKNGSSRSAEQWLPSDEGNRNPAIDERMLEQQEGGATIYSRQLGRGWGDEKNIKATKAWVMDTEKAGATKSTPEYPKTPDESDKASERGRIEGRTFDRMHTGRKDNNIRTEASRLKDDAVDKARFRSASPRLKRDNPGLTVEINKSGGRRVKRYSEGDSGQAAPSELVKRQPEASPEGRADLQSPVDPPTPFSAGVLKTPEGVEYVPDWAAEMDMQSPTYVKRQLELTEQDRPKCKQGLDTGRSDAACTQEKSEDIISSDDKIQSESDSLENASTSQNDAAPDVDEAVPLRKDTDQEEKQEKEANASGDEVSQTSQSKEEVGEGFAEEEKFYECDEDSNPEQRLEVARAKEEDSTSTALLTTAQTSLESTQSPVTEIVVPQQKMIPENSSDADTEKNVEVEETGPDTFLNDENNH